MTPGVVSEAIDVPNSDKTHAVGVGADHPITRRELCEEGKALFHLAWPVAFSVGSRFLINVTDVAILGHLGTDELAAATLCLVWLSITLLPVSRGFSAAVGALCAQAVGAKNFALVGLWLRTAFLLGTVLSIPLAGLWLLTGPVLAIAGVSSDIQALAQQFAMVSILWLLPQTLTLSLLAFLRAQEVVRPQAFISALFVAVNYAFNVAFVKGIGGFPGIGFVGSAVATAATRILLLAAIAGYALWYHPRAAAKALARAAAAPGIELRQTRDNGTADTAQWGQVTAPESAGNATQTQHSAHDEAGRCESAGSTGERDSQSVQKLSVEERRRLVVESTTAFVTMSPPISSSHARTMCKLVLMNAAGIALEEWQLQLVVLMAGWLGTTEVAAFTAVIELYFVLSAVMFGISSALVVRMGAHIGAGRIHSARAAMRAAFCVAFAFGLTTSAIMIMARNQLGYIFTSDPDVLFLTKQSWPLLGACYIAMCLFYIGMAVLQAQARPGVVAVAFLVGAWIVCIPLAAVLAFPAGAGLRGLWYALIAGYVTVTAIALRGIAKSDWVSVVALAQKRARGDTTDAEPTLLDTAAMGREDSNRVEEASAHV